MISLQKIALEIYLIFQKRRGAFSAISGFLKRDDASKLSRQINPNDDRRDNPYTELLEIHEAMARFSPEMEKEVWQVLERERSKFIPAETAAQMRTAERISKAYKELGDVIHKNNSRASQDEMEKEAFELFIASKELYESIKSESEAVH